MTSDPTAYVLGFCFSSDRQSVVLIQKLRPLWQRNRLNGIGGKIELSEHPRMAMSREFKEEAGVKTVPEEWSHFATIWGTDWQKDPSGETEAIVYCYELANDDYFNRASTQEEEKIIKVNNAYIPLTGWRECIPNLTVLIPLACSTEYQRPIELIWSKETQERRREEALK